MKERGRTACIFLIWSNAHISAKLPLCTNVLLSEVRMAPVSGSKNSLVVKGYIGDNKTLLAFNFTNAAAAKNLAGFTIQCQPQGQPAYYLFNELQFEDPSKHAQVATEKPN